MKTALGISGVITSVSAWSKRADDESGTQMYLLIIRNDNVVNMCEMKFYGGEFTLIKGIIKLFWGGRNCWQRNYRRNIPYTLHWLLLSDWLRMNIAEHLQM